VTDAKPGIAVVPDQVTHDRGPTEPADRSVISAVVVYPDATLKPVTLVGDDSDRFAAIRRLVGGTLTRLTIDDQDGPAAVGWIDENSTRGQYASNAVASALVDCAVAGPMVVTGRGRGHIAAMTSIHDGLLGVLEGMAERERQSR
jgi:hypothetical protein